jgi:tetratricopeptide (TPR) repeat protein
LSNYALFLDDVRQDFDRAEAFYKRAIEADPKYANALGGYAHFLQYDRRDADRAEEFYKRAIEADPKHANNLTNYAAFLRDVRREFDRAEEFYNKALGADAKNAYAIGGLGNILMFARHDHARGEEYLRRAVESEPRTADHQANLAQALLANGKIEEGMTLLREAMALLPAEKSVVGVELAFYGYCHGPPAEREQWLRRLKELLAAGVVSPWWNFTPNVEAVSGQHPAGPWLSKLAAVANGSAALDTLRDWDDWNRVEIA